MDKASTFTDELYHMYELHATLSHTVSSGEASANAIEILLVEPHAVANTGVAGDVKYTRAYINGVLTEVTGVTYLGTTTTVAFTALALVEGDIVDIYFPLTGTGKGSLVSNVNTGKLTLPEVQTVQGWKAEANRIKVEQCGTKRKKTVSFRSPGTVVLGLYRYGNTMMADFVAAMEGDSDSVKIPLLIDVVDTTTTPTTHDLLFQATASSSQRVSANEDSAQGVVTDTLVFRWVPKAVTL